jgi:hypothetical protein
MLQRAICNDFLCFYGLSEMKSPTLFLITTLSIIGAAQAQVAAPKHDVYLGLGLPGVVALGYAVPLGQTWGVRAEYAGGPKLSQDGSNNGVAYTGSVNASHFGGFVDWFPFGNGFRLVGGFTANDAKASLIGNGTGTATINGKTVSMVGQTFNVDIKFPSTTPYIGIGYGHQKSDLPGLGFYADAGLMFGTFTTAVTTSLTNATIDGVTITQADVDAQTQSMRDSLAKFNLLPRIAAGATYRF